MKKDNYQEWAQIILDLVGGSENVSSCVNCMTRLRITPKDDSLIKYSELEKLDFVIQVQKVQGVCQVVIGPGKVDHVRKYFDELIGNNSSEDLANEEANNKTKSQKAVAFMQAVMMPAISAIISAALINAILNIIRLFGVDIEGNQILNAFSIFAGVAISSLGVIFAVNTTKYFKGNVYISMLIAIFMVSPSISQVSIGSQQLMPGIGGIFSVMIMGYVVAVVGNKIKKIIPTTLQLLIVPLVTTIITLILLFIIIIPISGLLMKLLMNFFTFVVTGNKLIFVIASMILGAIYPILVLSGLHISVIAVLMPIYMETGHMPLIASAFLGGAAQLGTAYAVYIKEKNDYKIKEVFTAGAPSALLGVIEPLMYGINLPRVKPLIAACIAAGIGGLIVGLSGITMNYAISGLIGAVSFDSVSSMVTYALIWIGTAILGTIICMIIYRPKQK